MSDLKSVCSYKNAKKDYKCDIAVHDGGDRCLFHDENCLKGDKYEKNKNEVVNQLELQLISHPEGMPFKFIGYHLPECSFEETLFNQPVYFNDAIFYGSVSFRGATFSHKAHFFGTEFRKEANFERAIFLDKAFFNGAIFHKACFKEVKFSNNVYFSYRYIDRNKLGTTFWGIANFEDATFHKDASFNTATFRDEVTFFRATFFNIAYFFRVKFCKLVNFNECTFSSKTDYRTTYFYEALFRYVRFRSEVYFMDVVFKEKTLFNYSIFEQPNEIVFGLRDKDLNYREPIDCKPGKSQEEWLNTDISVGEFELSELDMSKVSFVNCDASRLRFTEKVKWGGDGFKVYDEEWFTETEGFNKKRKNEPYKEHNERNVDPKEECIFLYKKYDSPTLDGVISVYRSLRENYEFRLRYDDAGKFFIKEMELKRTYRKATGPSKIKLNLIKLAKWLKRDKTPIRDAPYLKNSWPRRQFSLTGLYYHLSRYGESISRPIILGGFIIGLSTLFWLMQNNPTGELSISYNAKTLADNFVNFTQFSNNTHTLKAFERSLADFLPLLSMPNDTKIGIIDFMVKIVGGGLTFVLLGVALRRKFERKYTR